MALIKEKLRASLSLTNRPRVKPRTGIFRKRGSCPPSRPRRLLYPARDLYPLFPLPDVLPLPDPSPRPIRCTLFLGREVFFNVERILISLYASSCAAFFAVFQLGERLERRPRLIDGVI